MSLPLHVTIALAQVEQAEVPKNSNAGPFVESCQRLTGNAKGDPWCASFVAWCGTAAYGKAWPVPLTGGCQALYEWAVGKQLVADAGTPGDLIVFWHATLSRFAHVAIMTGNGRAKTYRTVEGNTNDGGSREGYGVFGRTRVLSARDKVLRITEVVP